MNRAGIALLMVVLMLIALAGLGIGVWTIAKALELASMPHGSDGAMVLIALAMAPFLVGTVALAGIVTALIMDGNREELIKQTSILSDLREQGRLTPVTSTVPQIKSRGDIYG